MSFIDVIVGSSLVLIVFLALIGLLRASVLVAAVSKQKAVATTIAENGLERIRALDYDAVGTLGGIPPGIIPQEATTTMNGTDYAIRTFIGYVDDPADGLAENDDNGITADYKRIKVTVHYAAGGRPRTVDLLSNYAPPGIESANGGGTLAVEVVNAEGTGVAGASVRIENAETSPAVDLTTFSDANGKVFLPGAATSTEYRITVTKSGYSSARTYARDDTNQNPTPGYLTIAQDQTTTGTFAVDLLANLTMRTFAPIQTSVFTDSFVTSAKIESLSNAVVSGGGVTLAGGAGGYASSGSVLSIPTAPANLVSWMSATSTIGAPGSTAVAVQIVDGNGALLPDYVLPGNSGGFDGPIDLSAVSTTTYPALALRAQLSTSATSSTPALTAWTLTYRHGPEPLPNIPFTLTGTKAIGSTGGGAPILKTILAATTDAAGLRTLGLEWDSYRVTLSGYDTVDVCNAPPYALPPGSTQSTSLYLMPSTGTSLLVSARAATLSAIPGASVTLSRPGFSETVTTSACGGAYFGNLEASSAYTITVSKEGYATDTAEGVTVSGHSFYTSTL